VDIKRQIPLLNYVMQQVNALNALVNVAGAGAKHPVNGTQNTAHIPAVVTTQHTVRIKKAAVSHGDWKNQNAQMGKLQFYRVANGFARHLLAARLVPVHQEYAEPVQHYDAHCDNYLRPERGVILFCPIICFYDFFVI